jgi:hypothetical protein
LTDKTSREKVDANKSFLIQMIALAFLVFIMIWFDGHLTSYIIPDAFVLIVGIGAAIAFIAKKINKTTDYWGCLVVYGFPLAGIITAVIEAVGLISLDMLPHLFSFIVAPILYACILSLIFLPYHI